MKRLTRSNLVKGKVPNRSGLYYLYNRSGTKVYVGHSKVLRHRLQSYNQKDDFSAHPTKRRLRGSAVFFSYRTMPISKARKIDRVKQFRFNYS